MDAIILAVASDEGRRTFGYNKALICLSGKSILENVVDAARASGCIARIFVVGEEDELAAIADKVDGTVAPAGNPLENVLACVAKKQLKNELLILASDIPYLTAGAIQEFVDQSRNEAAEFYYPGMAKKTFQQLFPKYPKTFIKLRDGKFTSGSGFITSVSTVLRTRPFSESVLRNRKSPLKMATMMGWGNVILFALGMMSRKRIEKIIREKTGCSFKLVELSDAGLIFDIDRKEQLDELMAIRSGF